MTTTIDPKTFECETGELVVLGKAALGLASEMIFERLTHGTRVKDFHPGFDLTTHWHEHVQVKGRSWHKRGGAKVEVKPGAAAAASRWGILVVEQDYRTVRRAGLIPTASMISWDKARYNKTNGKLDVRLSKEFWSLPGVHDFTDAVREMDMEKIYNNVIRELGISKATA